MTTKSIQQNHCVFDTQSYPGSMKAFTLIELLVVVLIIAVLAMVALPQYKKALLKSRFTTLMPIAKATASSNESYFLENGEYASSLAVLTVEGQESYPNGTSLTLNNEGKFKYVMAGNANFPNNKYIVYQAHSEQFADNIHCSAAAEDMLANWLCGTALQGTLTTGSLEEGYKMYILQGAISDGHYNITYTNTGRTNLIDGDQCISTQNGGCGATIANNGSTCIAQNGVSGACYASSFDNSTCIAKTGSVDSCSGSLTRTSTFTNDSKCIGNGGTSCYMAYFTDSTCQAQGMASCNKGTYSNSTCEAGNAVYGCSGSTFTNASICRGNKPSSCEKGTFENSTCEGIGCSSGHFNHAICNGDAYSCGRYIDVSNPNASTTIAAYFDNQSVCNANGKYSCQAIAFTNHSVCNANVANSCLYNTYESGSYCAGNYCPAGSPTNDGQCWNGNGGKVTCPPAE